MSTVVGDWCPLPCIKTPHNRRIDKLFFYFKIARYVFRNQLHTSIAYIKSINEKP